MNRVFNMVPIHEVKTREHRIARGFSKEMARVISIISKKFLQLSIQIFDLFFAAQL